MTDSEANTARQGHAASGPRGVASHELHFRSVSGRRAPRRRHFRPDLRWQRRSRGRRSDCGGGVVSGLAEALARRFLVRGGGAWAGGPRGTPLGVCEERGPPRRGRPGRALRGLRGGLTRPLRASTEPLGTGGES